MAKISFIVHIIEEKFFKDLLIQCIDTQILKQYLAELNAGYILLRFSNLNFSCQYICTMLHQKLSHFLLVGLERKCERLIFFLDRQLLATVAKYYFHHVTSSCIQYIGKNVSIIIIFLPYISALGKKFLQSFLVCSSNLRKYVLFYVYIYLFSYIFSILKLSFDIVKRVTIKIVRILTQRFLLLVLLLI